MEADRSCVGEPSTPVHSVSHRPASRRERRQRGVSQRRENRGFLYSTFGEKPDERAPTNRITCLLSPPTRPSPEMNIE